MNHPIDIFKIISAKALTPIIWGFTGGRPFRGTWDEFKKAFPPSRYVPITFGNSTN